MADLAILFTAVVLGVVGYDAWSSASLDQYPPSTCAERRSGHLHGGALWVLAAGFVTCVFVRARRRWSSLLGIVVVVAGLLTLLPALVALEFGAVGLSLGTAAVASGLVAVGCTILRGPKPR